MVDAATTFDALVLGAGPAGVCAAMRLLTLGYKVALIERTAFPRPQIGESLSPGIRNIFDYLGAGHLLDRPEYISGLPTQMIWETEQPITVPADQRGTGIVVDRATLDDDLL